MKKLITFGLPVLMLALVLAGCDGSGGGGKNSDGSGNPGGTSSTGPTNPGSTSPTNPGSTSPTNPGSTSPTNPTNPGAVAVTGVSLNETSLSLKVGGSETLTATITPSNAANKNVTWSSSDTAVASVSTNGTVTAVSPGTATITVTTVDGSKTASCAITVTTATVPVTGVSLNKPSSVTYTGGGFSDTIQATVTPSNATNKTVRWSTSDPSVVGIGGNVINENGVMVGPVVNIGGKYKNGTAIITATTEDGGYTATCAVTIYVVP